MAEINPVLLKELRQRFRTGKTAWLLALYLLVIGAFVLGFMYLSWRGSPGIFQPDRSRSLFIMLSVTQLVLLGFVVPGLTAGVISGERERQTLNVLLTTRLTPRQIIWSKLVSACAFVVLLVVATLPLYSIVFMYGGIAPAQVLGVFGFYLVTIFLFGCIGVACSSFFKRTGVSTVTTYGLAFALAAGTGFLAVFLHEMNRLQARGGISPETWHPAFLAWVVEFLQDINPVFVLMQILGENGISTGVNFGLPGWAVYTLVYLAAGVRCSRNGRRCGVRTAAPQGITEAQKPVLTAAQKQALEKVYHAVPELKELSVQHVLDEGGKAWFVMLGNRTPGTDGGVQGAYAYLTFDTATGELLSYNFQNPAWASEKVPSPALAREKAAAFARQILGDRIKDYAQGDDMGFSGGGSASASPCRVRANN